jgi:hypothetical protein
MVATRRRAPARASGGDIAARRRVRARGKGELT